MHPSRAALHQRERELADSGLESADAAPDGRPECGSRVGHFCRRGRGRGGGGGGGAGGHHRAELVARRRLRDGEKHLRTGRGDIFFNLLRSNKLPLKFTL